MRKAFTPRDIEDRFEEAALTLRRLPNPPGSGPRGYGSAWPDYVREARHAYGWHEARMRVVPNPAEIQRMEECLTWLRWLDPDDARIVWMRAEGCRWKQVCYRVGVVRQTAWRRWAAALVTVAKHLNRQRKHGSNQRIAKLSLQKPADEHAAKPDKPGAGTLL
ncbi:MAG: DUF6362 family protein [Paracoccus sp. (in: a-proteobacteria)]|uniref:DUF6362 family protein n=1 Tax=Paracoccus sp. TaxID=267 RepID=UPI0026E01B0E|nr:DUF6362 family protein [Paracoccus sp. (in: a-proteobacteria)]MDO5622728.1 DUF6362 family protein [Paracoccus sp. (in: a-proteobacteria)]